MSRLPLLQARALDAPIAWRAGQAVSGVQFLAAAQRLAARLPVRGRPINLCQDRLLFALGLAAALLRGQTSLMPPNALPTTLAQLPAGDAPAYVLNDDPQLDVGGLANVDLAADELLGGAPALAAGQSIPDVDAALEAVCLLTSGSTGAPQPHAKRWAALLTNIGAEAARLAELIGRPSLAGVTLVATVPAQHSYGLESSVLLGLLGGASFDAGRPFYPADIAEALARVPRPRALVTTPFHLKALLQAGVALPPVDLTLSATAPLSPQLAAQAEAALGGPLVEIYGCTEAGQVAARRTTAGQTWRTLGALRLTRHADAAAEGGERFVVQGGHVTEPTALADILELDDAEHFRLLGRANDLIHVAGKRSSLAHLNFHLNRIEGVEDGAFWLPDEVSGEVTRPLAFVVAPRLGARAIVAALRRELEGAFVPRRVIHVEALPREATGKLTAAALGRFALEQLARLAGGDLAQPVTLQVASDHPAFAGHFPGHPVLPGAVLLAMVVDALLQRPALAARLGTPRVVEHVKFLAPVKPGTSLTLTFSQQARSLGFEVLAGAVTVARGALGPLAGRAARPSAVPSAVPLAAPFAAPGGAP